LTGLRRGLFCVLGAALLSCSPDHGLSPTASAPGSGISGRITFTGAWPDSTRDVVLVVSKKYPAGVTDRDGLLGFVLENFLNGNILLCDTIPRSSATYDYRVSLQPGTYEWVLVIWFPDTPEYLYGVKELGAYYRNPALQTTPSPVEIIDGVTYDRIDIPADFANVGRELPFFRRGRGR
jgi:hypothetical protein